LYAQNSFNFGVCSYKAFNIPHKESPSDDDIKEARILVDEYAAKSRETMKSVTPKGHVAGAHSIDQLIKHRENGLPIVIEQFVERNHQEGSIIDEQCKRIVCKEKRADKHCKRKALHGLASLRKRIKVVNAATSRGKYKQKSNEVTVPVLEGDGTAPLRRPSNEETNSSEMESENNAQVVITPSRSELLNNELGGSEATM